MLCGWRVLCNPSLSEDRLNSAQSDLRFTAKVDSNNEMAFQDLPLSRLENGTVVQSVHRKASSNENYSHLHRLALFNVRRNWIWYLKNWAEIIRTEDTDKADFQTIRKGGIENGYLSQLNVKVIQQEVWSSKLIRPFTHPSFEFYSNLTPGCHYVCMINFLILQFRFQSIHWRAHRSHDQALV